VRASLPHFVLAPSPPRTGSRLWILAGVGLTLAAVFFATDAADAATGLIRYKSGPIAITQDGVSVWVVNPDADTVTRIAAGPDTVVAQIAVGKAPKNLTIAPNGSEVWVTNHGSNTISVINTTTNTVAATLPALFGPSGILITPDGLKAHVVHQLSDSLLTFSVASRTVIDRKLLSHRPRAIAMASDGSKLFIQQYLSLQTTMRTDFFDGSGAPLGTGFQILVSPIPQGDGGYPGIIQAFAVGPSDTTLWLPCMDVNPQNGPINFPGTGQLTLNSTLQAVVREVRITNKVEMVETATTGRRRLNSAGANVQMPADVAFTSDGSMAYLPCSFSDDVLKINTNTNPPTTLTEIAVGAYPFGIAISPTADRAYVANFLDRNVSVINTITDTVIGTIATASETLTPSILNGKKLFSTSTGNLSTNSRIACAGCHPEGGHDGVNWDFSQFGDGKRNTQNLAGIFAKQPLHTIGDRDEVQDFEANIQVLHFGAGLASGTDNPSVGPPNAGRSQDLDDMAAYVNSIPLRDESPFRNPADQTLTSAAAAGKLIFESEEAGCAFCHPAPLFTDNILHDVGTFLSNDTSGYQGFVTPSLRGIFDTDPYLHAGHANTLDDVLVLRNPNDEHGKTSHLSSGQRSDLVAYLRSIVGGREEDTTPPRIEYARAVDVTEVIVRFLEPVDAATATNIANYSINGGAVQILSASLDPFQSYMAKDGLTVHLFTYPHQVGPTYTLTVTGVKDLSSNANAIPGGGASTTYTYASQATFTFSNIDSLYVSRLARDTYASSNDPTWNFGKSTELKVGAGTGTSRAMAKFDFHPMLSTVVADTNDILSAKIRLKLKSQASTDPVTIYAYRLLRTFVEGSGGDPTGGALTNQTNWNSAREGRFPWGSAGAGLSASGVEGDAKTDYSSTNDRAFTPDDSAVVSVVDATYEWDVTHAVRWAHANPYFYNFGHVFVAAGEAALSEKVFYSLQDANESNRPVLEITLNANTVTAVESPGASSALAFGLAQSRPNPAFGGASTIAFTLPREEFVTLRIFDASGRSVRTLVDGRYGPGAHEVRWDGRDQSGRGVAAGTYFYRVKAGRYSDARRLVLIR
jgi:YVTN family beta-propeller protein